MTRPTRRLLAGTSAAIASLAIIASATSQSASGFDLSWRALFGGGTSSGGSYTAQGVIGQPFARSSTGGSYTVDSGFLSGVAVKFRRTLPFLSKDGTQ